MWEQYEEAEITNCKKMAACLLKSLDEFDKADMQSATVLLGLMPTAMAYVSPTVSELALVSSRRPVLASLMALGAPALFVPRLLVFNGIGESLSKDKWSRVVRKKTTRKAVGISFLQYLFVAAAVINCLENSISLGNQTILSWKCLWPYMQLIWNVLSLVPFILAACSLRCCSKVSGY